AALATATATVLGRRFLDLFVGFLTHSHAFAGDPRLPCRGRSAPRTGPGSRPEAARAGGLRARTGARPWTPGEMHRARRRARPVGAWPGAGRGAGPGAADRRSRGRRA